MRRLYYILGLTILNLQPVQAQETINRAEECFAELSAVATLRGFYEEQNILDETIPAHARLAEAQGYATLAAKQAISAGAFALNDAGNGFSAKDNDRVIALMTEKLNVLVGIGEGGAGLQIILAHSFIDACKDDLKFD